jgi:hypothetical protein
MIGAVTAGTAVDQEGHAMAPMPTLSAATSSLITRLPLPSRFLIRPQLLTRLF